MPRPNFLVTVEFSVAAPNDDEANNQVISQLVPGFKNWEIVSTEEE